MIAVTSSRHRLSMVLNMSGTRSLMLMPKTVIATCAVTKGKIMKYSFVEDVVCVVLCAVAFIVSYLFLASL
jgi:hypothetical protein